MIIIANLKKLEDDKQYGRQPAGSINLPGGEKITVDYILGGCGILTTMSNGDRYLFDATDIVDGILNIDSTNEAIT